MVLLWICRGCSKRKGISPAVQEKGENSLHVEYIEESPDRKDYTTAHHQLQQSSSQPIYEAIRANESSSTYSQESPSSKPFSSATDNVYSQLDQSNTYAQIEPHISASILASANPSAPDSGSDYQHLNHRTASLKRELPSRPVQAVNPTALAVAQGEVDERDLPGPQGSGRIATGSSSSLPRNTGHPSTNHPHSHPSIESMPPKRQHLEQVQLKNPFNDSESSEQNNFYHTLEPPPEYDTLEQVDECSQVSTTAVCDNVTTRESHGSRTTEDSPPQPSQQHQQQLGAIHPRSATLPSSQSSPLSSRTSSMSSSSPLTNRSNRSPLLNGGNNVSEHNKVMNKYSESPTSSRRVSGSPQTNRLSKSSRFSSQSDGNAEVQSDLGNRSTRDTLV